MLEPVTRDFEGPIQAAPDAAFGHDELHWALAGWAKVAPGIGGWRVQVAQTALCGGQTVLVAPPSPLVYPMLGPKYVITSTVTGQAELFADVPNAPLRKIGTFISLGEALHTLCPLTAAQENMADSLAALTRKF